MRFKLLCIILFVTVIFIDIIKAEEPAKDDKFPVKVGGMLWASWQTGFSKNYRDEQTFKIDRAYLSINKNFNEYIKANVIWNVISSYDSNMTGSYNATYNTISFSGRTEYHSYLEVAELVAEKTFNAVTLGAKIGIIDTPYLYECGRNDDFYINGDTAFTHDVDPLYDVGVGAKINVMKFVEFYGTITRGEGFLHIASESNNGKAFAGRLSITPIEPLAISGYYYRNQVELNGNSEGYYGIAASIKNKFIRAGFSGVKLFSQKSIMGTIDGGQTTLRKQLMHVGLLSGIYPSYAKSNGGDRILDIWLNFNLKSLTNLPILIWSSWENYYDDKATTSQYSFYGTTFAILDKSDTKDYSRAGIGVGYQVTENVELNVWFARKKLKQTLMGNDRLRNTLYFKTICTF